MGEHSSGTAGRRTVLKLLAASIAGASALRARVARAAEPAVRIGDAAIMLEFDAALRSRVLAPSGNAFEPITDYEAGETSPTCGW